MNKETTTTVRLDRKLAEAVRKMALDEKRTVKAQLDLLVKFAIFYGCAPAGVGLQFDSSAKKWIVKRKEANHVAKLPTRRKIQSE